MGQPQRVRQARAEGWIPPAAQPWLRSPRVRGALLAGIWLLLALHGLGDVAVVGDDEAREVGIVQDIVAGHWLWPRFNDDLLPDKPTLSHWLAAIPCALFGFSETAVRLPSVLAAAATIWWTVEFGSWLLGPPAGLAAGVVLATCRSFFAHARVARPDTLLVLLLALTLGCAYRWWRDDRRGDATLALALLGLGVLAKGPVAPALFLATFGLFLLWQRDLRRLLGFWTAAGLVALAALGLGWYALAWSGWGDTFVQQHLVGRYLRNLAGGLASGGSYSPKPWYHHVFFYPQHLPGVGLALDAVRRAGAVAALASGRPARSRGRASCSAGRWRRWSSSRRRNGSCATTCCRRCRRWRCSPVPRWPASFATPVVPLRLTRGSVATAILFAVGAGAAALVYLGTPRVAVRVRPADARRRPDAPSAAPAPRRPSSASSPEWWRWRSRAAPGAASSSWWRARASCGWRRASPGSMRRPASAIR